MSGLRRAEERLWGDLRQSVLQNGRAHLHIIESGKQGTSTNYPAMHARHAHQEPVMFWRGIEIVPQKQGTPACTLVSLATMCLS